MLLIGVRFHAPAERTPNARTTSNAMHTHHAQSLSHSFAELALMMRLRLVYCLVQQESRILVQGANHALLTLHANLSLMVRQRNQLSVQPPHWRRNLHQVPPTSQHLLPPKSLQQSQRMHLLVGQLNIQRLSPQGTLPYARHWPQQGAQQDTRLVSLPSLQLCCQHGSLQINRPAHPVKSQLFIQPRVQPQAPRSHRSCQLYLKFQKIRFTVE